MALIANVDWGWFTPPLDGYTCEDQSCQRVPKVWAYSDPQGSNMPGAYPVYRRLCFEHFFAAGKYETISHRIEWEAWKHGAVVGMPWR